ncbi:MAG: hypothetical protein HQ483_06030 [Rhodospirillales bacterium]|nr:hypothetical protein [Rhodospirillales bacterium]
METETAISYHDWEPATPVASDTILAVIFGNALFLAVGKGGTVRTSVDGTRWTQQNSTVTADLYGACWSPHKSVFVISGDRGTILTSPDGVTWTKQSSGADAYALSAVVWSEAIKLFVVVSGTSQLLISADASTWNPQNVGSRNRRGVCWSDHLGLFLYA